MPGFWQDVCDETNSFSRRLTLGGSGESLRSFKLQIPQVARVHGPKDHSPDAAGKNDSVEAVRNKTRVWNEHPRMFHLTRERPQSLFRLVGSGDNAWLQLPTFKASQQRFWWTNMREYPVIRSQVGMNGPMCVDLCPSCGAAQGPNSGPFTVSQVSSQNRSSVFIDPPVSAPDP
ncbi:hypothetical protein NW755_012170 [Fusarium falciforme]|uniref:Uncharacterized protein n=1 Tax=Fusarium falciforme TaxID=195108 RepID=A0A9W8QXW1_9HYPO|nr:hypothetical protein NW755_012170 [Fusarium falciforme]